MVAFFHRKSALVCAGIVVFFSSHQLVSAAPIYVGGGVDQVNVIFNWPDGFIRDYVVNYGSSPTSTIDGYDATTTALADLNLSETWTNYGNATVPNYFLNIAKYAGGHIGDSATYSYPERQNNYWAEWVNANDGSGWLYGNGASNDVLSPGQSIGWVFGSTNTPVPEPASLSSIAVAGIALLKRKRRRALLGNCALAGGLGSLLITPLDVKADYVYNPSDFSTSVIDTTVPMTGAPYSDPTAILGQPPVMFNSSANPNVVQSERVKIVEPAYNTDLSGNQVLTELPTDPVTEVTVQMGRPITHDASHPFGLDLIVFGNSFYRAGVVSDATNLNNLTVGQIVGHPVQVSVSPDDAHWFSFAPTSVLQPYNGYRWDAANAAWTNEELNPTIPLNPAYDAPNYFSGTTAAQVLAAYGNSAGGTGFDLTSAFDSNGNTLFQDGFSSIDYVQVASNGSDYAVISGISAVSDGSPVGNTTWIPEPGNMTSVVLSGLALMRRLRG